MIPKNAIPAVALACALGALVVACGGGDDTQVVSSGTVLTNATVVDTRDGSTRSGLNVVIDGGRIQRITGAVGAGHGLDAGRRRDGQVRRARLPGHAHPSLQCIDLFGGGNGRGAEAAGRKRHHRRARDGRFAQLAAAGHAAQRRSGGRQGRHAGDPADAGTRHRHRADRQTARSMSARRWPRPTPRPRRCRKSRRRRLTVPASSRRSTPAAPRSWR